ncbi:MAG: glycosyltransferase family 39 protein [Planctomycetaceae bacterium]|nr:glycosyltransferase family 39 protein [Planctomycetaceae bacterium]
MSLAKDCNSGVSDRSSFGWDLALLVLVAGSVFFTNLGGAKLWDRDEPRNAGCAIEMLQRGDWVTPMFNAELRGQKPVLTYWLMMSAISVFGNNEFAVRFSSALLGVGTVLLTYAWIRHLLFPMIARWTGLILSTTLMFTLASRAATPDAPLIFCTSLAIALYVWLTFQPSQHRDWEGVFSESRSARLRRPGVWFPTGWGAVLVYAAMALGVLAKGPVAVVLPTLVIGLFILVESSFEVYASEPESRRGWQWWAYRVLSVIHPQRFCRAVWQMQPWWLVAMVVCISLPWFVWVGLRTDGEFLRQFFFREHFERATTAMEGHRGGWWFYPLAILIGVFPWSIVVLPAFLIWSRLVQGPASDSRMIQRVSGVANESTPASGRWSSAWTLATVWVGLQVTIFSLASTKLPSYVTPCYPAVALLLALVPTQLSLSQWSLRPFWLRAGFATWIGSGLAVSGVLTYVLVAKMQWNVGWLPALGLTLLIGGVVAWYCLERQQLRRVTQVMFSTSWLFIVSAFGFATHYVSEYRSTDELWQIARQHQGEGALLASYRDLESTWVYYAKQPIWELDPTPQTEPDAAETDAAATESSHPLAPSVDPFIRQHDWQIKPRATVAELVRFRPGSVIVTPERYATELLDQLPDEYVRLADRNDFLTRNQLVLIGPKPNRWREQERQAKAVASESR